jgi:hypothetical protein
MMVCSDTVLRMKGCSDTIVCSSNTVRKATRTLDAIAAGAYRVL